MNKDASVTMAAAMAVAGILTLAILTIAIQHQAFAQADNQRSSYGNNNQCCEPQQPPKCCEPQQPPKCCEPQQPPKCCDNNDNKQPEKKTDIATGGNGGSGGAGGAGGEGGQGGTNTVKNMEKSGYQNTAYVSSSGSGINQKANGGDANGGHGGNANGGNANVGDAST
jgi:hypothetical protein